MDSAPAKTTASESKQRNSAKAAPRRVLRSLAPVAVPAAMRSSLPPGGQPLPDAVRTQMEARFGQDFSDVVVHHGPAAERLAAQHHANAYALGTHIVFGAHRFSPNTPQGQRLIAHELAHVIQQRRGGPPAGKSQPILEVHADRAADAAVPGTTSVPVVGNAGVGVMCDDSKRKRKRRWDDEKEFGEDREEERRRDSERTRDTQRARARAGKAQETSPYRQQQVDEARRELDELDAAYTNGGGRTRSEVRKRADIKRAQELMKILYGDDREVRGIRSNRQGAFDETARTPGPGRRAGTPQSKMVRGGPLVPPLVDGPDREGGFAKPDYVMYRRKKDGSFVKLFVNLKSDQLWRLKQSDAVARARTAADQAMSNATHLPVGEENIYIRYAFAPSREIQQAMLAALFRQDSPIKEVSFGPGAPHYRVEDYKGPKEEARFGPPKRKRASSDPAAVEERRQRKRERDRANAKRRRDRKKQAAAGNGPAAPAAPQLTDAQKRERRREQNRVSAQRRRDQKKQAASAAAATPKPETPDSKAPEAKQKHRKATNNDPAAAAETAAESSPGAVKKLTASASKKVSTAKPPAVAAPSKPEKTRNAAKPDKPQPKSSSTADAEAAKAAKPVKAAKPIQPAKPAEPSQQANPPANAQPSGTQQQPSKVKKAATQSPPTPPPQAKLPDAQKTAAVPKPATPVEKKAKPAAPKVARGPAPPITQKAPAPAPAAKPAQGAVTKPKTRPRIPSGRPQGSAQSQTQFYQGNHVQVTVSEDTGDLARPFRVRTSVTIDASLAFGASGGRRTNVGMNVNASTMRSYSNEHLMSAQEKNQYLAAIAGGRGGPNPELQMAELIAHGKLKDVVALIEQVNGGLNSPTAIKDRAEGSTVDISSQTEGGGGLSLARGPIGVSGSVSLGEGIQRSSTKTNGKELIKVVVRGSSGESLGGSLGVGVAAGGHTGQSDQSVERYVSFMLDPSDPQYAAKRSRILAANTIEELNAIGGAYGHGEQKQTSESGTTSASVLGLGLELDNGSFGGEGESEDGDGGKVRTVTGGASIGGSFTILGERVGTSSKTDSYSGVTYSDNTGEGATQSEDREIDEEATRQRMLELAEDVGPMEAMWAAARRDKSVIKERVDVEGAFLSDESFDRITAVAHDPHAWFKAWNLDGVSRGASVEWEKTRQKVVAAKGDRHLIQKALADWQRGDSGRSGDVERLAGDTGIAFDFPAELASQRPVYEQLVVHSPVTRAQQLLDEGKAAQAVTELEAINARLNQLVMAIQLHEQSIDSPKKFVEMQQRIATRREQIRGALSKARAAVRGAMPGETGFIGPTQAGDAAIAEVERAKQEALEARKATNEKIEDLVRIALSNQEKEARVFAAIAGEQDDVFVDLNYIATHLNSLRPMYETWDTQTAQLRELFQKLGDSPGRADKFAPNWTRYDQLYAVSFGKRRY